MTRCVIIQWVAVHRPVARAAAKANVGPIVPYAEAESSPVPILNELTAADSAVTPCDTPVRTR